MGNKNLVVYTEVEVEFYCQMKFELYPFDSHVCRFFVGQYDHNYPEIRMLLENFTFHDSDQVTCLDYSIQVNKLQDNLTLLEYMYEGKKMYWSREGFQIKLNRNFKKYIFNYYIPSGLMVTVSWVSTNCGL